MEPLLFTIIACTRSSSMRSLPYVYIVWHVLVVHECRDTLESAADKYYHAIHTLKRTLRMEDATTAEKLASVLNDAQKRVRDAMTALTSLPSSITDSVKGGFGNMAGLPPGADYSSEALSETARAYYEDALNRGLEAVMASRLDIDNKLRGSNLGNKPSVQVRDFGTLVCKRTRRQLLI